MVVHCQICEPSRNLKRIPMPKHSKHRRLTKIVYHFESYQPVCVATVPVRGVFIKVDKAGFIARRENAEKAPSTGTLAMQASYQLELKYDLYLPSRSLHQVSANGQECRFKTVHLTINAGNTPFCNMA